MQAVNVTESAVSLRRSLRNLALAWLVFAGGVAVLVVAATSL